MNKAIQVTVNLKTNTLMIYKQSGNDYMNVYLPKIDKTKACDNNENLTNMEFQPNDIIYISKKGNFVSLIKTNFIPNAYHQKQKIMNISTIGHKPALNLVYVKLENGENTILIGEDNGRDGIIKGSGVNLSVQDVYVLLDKNLILWMFFEKETKLFSSCPIKQNEKHFYSLDTTIKPCTPALDCKCKKE